MAISWSSISTLGFLILPFLLPKALAFYRSVRTSETHQTAIRPTSPAVSRALFILFATALAFVIKSLPLFAPENILQRTQSRLQIPTDVLFNRLLPLRPFGLTAADEILRSKFNSMDSRLLFLQYGPDVLSNCQFCNGDDTNSYLYYAIPSILAPHLFNLCVLAATTSGLFTGKEGAAWRTTATLAAAGAAIFDIYSLNTYNYQANTRALRLEEIDNFFWKARVYRYLAIAAIDGVIGWFIYLSATNRAFRNPPSTADRLTTSTLTLHRMRSKLQALIILKNTVNRDDKLLGEKNKFWIDDARVLRAAMEDREVVESLNDALENRVDMREVEGMAEGYSRELVGYLGELGSEKRSMDT